MQGTLKGYDQATNLVLHDCHERVYSTQVSSKGSTLLQAVVPALATAIQICGRSPLYGHAMICLVPLQKGMERQNLGLQVLRGDNMCVPCLSSGLQARCPAVYSCGRASLSLRSWAGVVTDDCALVCPAALSGGAEAQGCAEGWWAKWMTRGMRSWTGAVCMQHP